MMMVTNLCSSATSCSLAQLLLLFFPNHHHYQFNKPISIICIIINTSLYSSLLSSSSSSSSLYYVRDHFDNGSSSISPRSSLSSYSRSHLFASASPFLSFFFGGIFLKELYCIKSGSYLPTPGAPSPKKVFMGYSQRSVKTRHNGPMSVTRAISLNSSWEKSKKKVGKGFYLGPVRIVYVQHTNRTYL